MGKGLILFILGLLPVIGIITIGMNDNVNSAIEQSVEQYADVQARNIANSMINILISDLSDSLELRYTSSSSKSLFGGTATYTMKDTLLGTDSLVQIRAIGNYFDISREAIAYIEIPTEGGTAELPPFLNYAICGGDEVTLNGTQINVRHAQHPTYNTDVHSNNKVTLNGDFIGVEGFVTYKNSVDIGGKKIDIDPINNPDGDPVHSKAPAITIPIVKASDYKDIATKTYSGDKTFSGKVYLGTKESPEIIYVKGKIEFQETKIYGYGVFVSTDEVLIKGDVTSNSPDPNYSKVGIFTEGKTILDDEKITLHSTVVANEEIVINGKWADIWGSLVSKSKVTLNNEKITLYYKPLSAEVADGFWDVETTGGKFTGRLSPTYYYQ